MNSKLKDAHMDELFEGVLSLTSVEECYNFFEDLCTITELRAMAQRGLSPLDASYETCVLDSMTARSDSDYLTRIDIPVGGPVARPD